MKIEKKCYQILLHDYIVAPLLHICIDESQPPLTKSPLGNTNNEVISSNFPVSLPTSLSSSIFHITISSKQPLARYPFDNTNNEYALDKCPVRVVIKVPVSVFHIFIVPSALPQARLPFGNTANDSTISVCQNGS